MSFTRLESADLVISADSIVRGLWTADNYTLSSFHTSSNQAASTTGLFYLEVYNTSSLLTGSEVQFSIAYGHKLGSGSSLFNGLVTESSPTKVTYDQYRNLVLGDENTNFTFNSIESRDIFVLNINRARYKESLFPGTFNIRLSGSLGNTLVLTDNSRNTTSISYCDAGRIFQIVSGSNGQYVSNSISSTGITNSGSYGYFLPDVGLIVLNPRALALPLANGGISMSIDESSNTTPTISNETKLFRTISGSGNFQLNSQETVSSNYVFVRVRNADYNYSTNPSIISGSTGEIVYPELINNPQTYITTVGLYNDNNDLLAVAKLSKPLPKNFTKESNIRIKLDF